MNTPIVEYNKTRKKNNVLPISILLFTLLSTGGTILYFIYYGSPLKIDYQRDISSVWVKGEKQKDSRLTVEGKNYLSIDFLKENVDEAIHLNEDQTMVIVTPSKNIVYVRENEKSVKINDDINQLSIPAYVTESGEAYLSEEMIEAVYPVALEERKNGELTLQKDKDIRKMATVKELPFTDKISLRHEPSKFSPSYNTIEEKEEIEILSEDGDMLFIETPNGTKGFINQKAIKSVKEETVAITNPLPIYPSAPINEPIRLTWEAVYTKNPNTSNLGVMEGVNVVSPTWFHVENEEGDLKNLASSSYMEWAKNRDYHVWALFSNNFDPALTHQVLDDYETRKKMIDTLLHYVAIYQLDGINIDFENVNLEDGPLFTQFVREISAALHQVGKVVSVDVTFISTSGNWSAFLEREKLAEVVDYMMVMAYDEHWGTSPVAGSVASIPWVEANLQRLLEQVPSDKVVLGVPLYTRLWKEEVMESGEINVSSEALSMQKAAQWVKERNLTPVYDEETGQDFVSYEEGNVTYKIWLENETSLKKRAELTSTYNLAGVATWARFFGTDDAFASLHDTFLTLEARGDKLPNL